MNKKHYHEEDLKMVGELVYIWKEVVGEDVVCFDKKIGQYNDKDRLQLDCLIKLIDLFGFEKVKSIVMKIPSMNEQRKKKIKLPVDLFNTELSI